jgi:uncharacterized RmlC-like cupin family protein/ketosteroid isomerase-like protein
MRDQVTRIVEQYIEAVRRNDTSALPLHPDAVCEFPTSTYRGAAALAQGLDAFARMVKRIDVVRLVVDGEHCVALVNIDTVFGVVPFAEHIHVADGRIVSIRGYCDPRPMTAGAPAAAAETRPCRVVRTGDAYQGRQGLTYLAGLTGATAGSRGICMTVAVLPPGARAKAHLHRGIETAVHVLEGQASMFWGHRLEELLVARAGDYVYVPADTAHLVLNQSDTECRAVIAHSSASDQDGIVMLPDLDTVHQPA